MKFETGRVTNLLENIPPPPRMQGRGIVTTAGGALYFPNAYGNIALLRHLGCTLPVEWFYCNSSDMKPAWLRAAESLGNVTCINLEYPGSNFMKARGGWQSKSKAMLQCSFKEILFLDADCFVERDPTYLFDSRAYLEYNAIFPPDMLRWRQETFAPAGEFFGVSFKDEFEFEGGSALINKAACWTALNLADLYNVCSEDTYQVVYGDKNTFYFAWRKTGTPYLINPPCTPARGMMLQYDAEGNLIFRHLTGMKWDLTGETKLTEQEFPHARFVSSTIKSLGEYD